VTHNSVISRMADRVVRLRSGRVSEVTRNESPEAPESLVW
jgi:putative ABC transport system ATP-binding protein